jgi:hypothetical protein
LKTSDPLHGSSPFLSSSNGSRKSGGGISDRWHPYFRLLAPLIPIARTPLSIARTPLSAHVQPRSAHVEDSLESLAPPSPITRPCVSIRRIPCFDQWHPHFRSLAGAFPIAGRVLSDGSHPSFRRVAGLFRVVVPIAEEGCRDLSEFCVRRGLLARPPSHQKFDGPRLIGYHDKSCVRPKSGRSRGLRGQRPRSFRPGVSPIFLSSSMAEHPAVNRRVAGSSPA